MIGRGEKTPTPKILALLRKRPVLLRANFVLTKDRKRLYYGHFCGKMHREGSCSKAAGVLSKVQMPTLVLGGSFPFFQDETCDSVGLVQSTKHPKAGSTKQFRKNLKAPTLIWGPKIGTNETMTARDVTGFYVFFSPGDRAVFSTFWGDFLTKLVNLEKKEEAHRRKFKISSETAPRNCQFLSLVVVKRALKKYEKIPVKYENGPKMTSFVLLLVFFVFSGTKPRWGIRSFFRIFSVFPALGSFCALYEPDGIAR